MNRSEADELTRAQIALMLVWEWSNPIHARRYLATLSPERHAELRTLAEDHRAKEPGA